MEGHWAKFLEQKCYNQQVEECLAKLTGLSAARDPLDGDLLVRLAERLGDRVPGEMLLVSKLD